MTSSDSDHARLGSLHFYIVHLLHRAKMAFQVRGEGCIVRCIDVYEYDLSGMTNQVIIVELAVTVYVRKV